MNCTSLPTSCLLPFFRKDANNNWFGFLGPAYNATLRQCDNATIHDFILILPSHFIFNKVRHLQVSPRQVKINIMRHNVENGVKINKMRQCPFLKQQNATPVANFIIVSFITKFKPIKNSSDKIVQVSKV